MQAVWKVAPADPRSAERLAEALSIHPLTAQVLLNRGLADAAAAGRFLQPTLEALEDPLAISDLPLAVNRLRRAAASNDPVVIFGDSDVDGLTASVILSEVLQQLGARVSAHQSNRLRDGYGVPRTFLRQLKRLKGRVLILVDCGTNQAEDVRRVTAEGIAVIIVDHHVPLSEAAKPFALVNPYCGRSAAGRGLCSAGLALKIAQALLRQPAHEALHPYLDLAALGTLADCAPLLGDNRVMVVEGLPRLLQTHRPGLRRVCESTSISQAEPEQILKRLTPRLNASGRLGEASTVWRLLRGVAPAAIDELLKANAADHGTTKRLQRRIVAEAHEQANRLHCRDQRVIVVSGRGWHQGLMGPLASQLAERYGRPAIAVAVNGQRGIGSGRSVPHVNLLDVLQACRSLLMRFGGHAQACGLTMHQRHLEPFRALINEQARRLHGAAGWIKRRLIDLELPLEAMAPGWVGELQRCAPFGAGNPRPTVVVRNLTIELASPRIARLSDGQRSIRGKGVFGGVLPDGRYDVLATPALEGDGVVMQVADVKVSTGLALHGRI